MRAAVLPIPSGTRISDIAADITIVILSILAKLPRSRRPRRSEGWCVSPGVQADMKAEWQQREKVKSVRVDLNSKNLDTVCKVAVLKFSYAHSYKLEARVATGRTL